jgi:hypothetical protein
MTVVVVVVAMVVVAVVTKEAAYSGTFGYNQERSHCI